MTNIEIFFQICNLVIQGGMFLIGLIPAIIHIFQILEEKKKEKKRKGLPTEEKQSDVEDEGNPTPRA